MGIKDALNAPAHARRVNNFWQAATGAMEAEEDKRLYDEMVATEDRKDREQGWNYYAEDLQQAAADDAAEQEITDSMADWRENDFTPAEGT